MLFTRLKYRLKDLVIRQRGCEPVPERTASPCTTVHCLQFDDSLIGFVSLMAALSSLEFRKRGFRNYEVVRFLDYCTCAEENQYTMAIALKGVASVRKLY